MTHRNSVRSAELEFLNQALKVVESGKPQSLYLYGEEGVGKSHLLDKFLNQQSGAELLFYFNPGVREENPTDFLREIFFYLWNKEGTFYDEIRAYFIQHTRGEINVLSEEPSQIFKNHQYQYYYHKIPSLLRDFILIASQYRPALLIFENLENYTHKTKEWLTQLIGGINHQILTIFTGFSAQIPTELPDTVQSYEVQNLNVSQVEKVVRKMIKKGSLNAKFITNYIHVKSSGKAALMEVMIQTYFNDPKLYKKGVLDARDLNPALIANNWMKLWEYRWNLLKPDSGIKKILSYIWLFSNESSYDFWSRLFRNLKMLNDFKKAEHEKWIKFEYSLDKKRVGFVDSSLLRFLKIVIPEEKIIEDLEKSKIKAASDKIIAHLSQNSMLLNVFKLNAYKLNKTFDEIQNYIALGKYSQAINILTTIILSQEFDKLSRSNRIRIFYSLAELYEFTRNSENALMYFHRLKDLIPSSDKETLHEVEFRIAENLFKMDMIMEAANQLRRLDSEGDLPDVLRAQIYMVFGMIYFANLQKKESITYYDKSIRILKNISMDDKAEELLADVHVKIAFSLRDTENYKGALRHLDEAREIYKKQGYISKYLKVILNKVYLWRQSLEAKEAIRFILSEYVKIRNYYAPGIVEIVQKQLAELYWIIGKWRHAREYYKRLFELFSWKGDLYNASFMLGNMATIAKETGEFGQAIMLEERALRLEHISQNVKAMVYSFQNLGHLYLMIGSHFTAAEQLAKAYHLAEKNNLVPEQIQSLLLEGFLNTRQKFLDKAGDHLVAAKELIDLSNDEWSWINYLFYSAYLKYMQKEYTEAASSISLFLKKSSYNYKYQCTGLYLRGLIRMENPETVNDAAKDLHNALEMTAQMPMVFWRYQIAYALARLYEIKNQGIDAEKLLGVALESMIKISRSLKDKILETQFWESADVSEIMDEIKRIPDLNLKYIQWQIEQ